MNMHGLPARLRQFWHSINGRQDQSAAFPGSIQQTDVTLLPLLKRDDIVDLRNRALNLLKSSEHDKAVLQRHHGENRSPRRGAGLDYEESRTYVAGDERRFINWRLTARSNETYVKIFREERQPSAFILLDRRNSMRFGTRVRLKVTQAIRTAVLLSFYQHYCGRIVSGAILDETLHWLGNTSDEAGLLTFIDIMNQPCPSQKPDVRPASLMHTLYILQNALSPGTRIYLVSDFIDMTSDCRAILTQLAAQHSVSAIHIFDPAEVELPAAGTLRMTATLATRALEIDTTDTSIATQFHSIAKQNIDQRETLLRGSGADYCRLTTTTDAIDTDITFG